MTNSDPFAAVLDRLAFFIGGTALGILLSLAAGGF